MAIESEIRGDLKHRIIGRLFGWILRLVGSTLKIKFTDKSGLLNKVDAPIIWTFWHNSVFVLPCLTRTFITRRKLAVLTSASKDGAILESAVAVFGIKAIRGSSSRRAVAALIALRQAVKSGKDICVTPDGPRGPRYILQPGVLKVAELTRAPIVPVRVDFGRCWTLRTWDAFRIPIPFSEVAVTLDTPRMVEPGLSEDQFESVRLELEKLMQQGRDDI